MELFGEFEEKGYRFRAFLPGGAEEGLALRSEIHDGGRLLIVEELS